MGPKGAVRRGGEKQNNMIKKNVVCSLALGLAVTALSSSKKENKENIYYDELQELAQEAPLGGDTLSPNELKGSMVILNFWASYDPASRINTYNLLRMNNEYEDATFEGGNGLKVVCISLDTYKAPLRKAIEADGTAELAHFCDFQGTASPLAQNFDVKAPVNLLLNKDGKILARDFGTSTIDETLTYMRSNHDE